MAAAQLRLALEQCLSHDPNVRKPAEELLRSNEKVRQRHTALLAELFCVIFTPCGLLKNTPQAAGFNTLLLEICSAGDCPAQTRQLAIMYLKNNVQR